jgi:hypothetical protein
MRRATVPFLLIFLLGGCTSPTVQPTDGSAPVLLSQVPTGSRIFRGDYSKLATCSFMTISTREPSLQKADLPEVKTINISLSQSGIKYWNINFKHVAPSETEVNISTASTIAGPFPGTDKIMNDIQNCASRL